MKTLSVRIVHTDPCMYRILKRYLETSRIKTLQHLYTFKVQKEFGGLDLLIIEHEPVSPLRMDGKALYKKLCEAGNAAPTLFVTSVRGTPKPIEDQWLLSNPQDFHAFTSAIEGMVISLEGFFIGENDPNSGPVWRAAHRNLDTGETITGPSSLYKKTTTARQIH